MAGVGVLVGDLVGVLALMVGNIGTFAAVEDGVVAAIANCAGLYVGAGSGQVAVG